MSHDLNNKPNRGEHSSLHRWLTWLFANNEHPHDRIAGRLGQVATIAGVIIAFLSLVVAIFFGVIGNFRSAGSSNVHPIVTMTTGVNGQATVQSYNISTDWSAASANGTWSYGQEDPQGSNFVPYTDEHDELGGALQAWDSPGNVYGDPRVCKNISNSQIWDRSAAWDAQQTTFHPGRDGQLSVYRFTAPVSGDYTITSEFAPCDGGRTVVFILASGKQIYTADLALTPNANFSGDETLSAGETIDFAVGVRPGTHFNNDTTAINATIRLVSTIP